MIQSIATVVQKESIAPAWWQMTISAPDLSSGITPGQFLMVRCGDADSGCYLRRPLYLRPIDGEWFTALLRPDPDPGFSFLTARQGGDQLDYIGTLGAGFELPKDVRHLLLIGDTQLISPLLAQMDRAVATEISVTLALSGHRAAAIYPVPHLPPAVEFHTATLDGSAGHRGPVTDLLPPLIGWADMVCAVGSTGLYRTLKDLAQTIRFTLQTGFLFGLATNLTVACGVGACFGCTLKTTQGLKFLCVDGPVFDLAYFEFEDSL